MEMKLGVSRSIPSSSEPSKPLSDVQTNFGVVLPHSPLLQRAPQVPLLPAEGLSQLFPLIWGQFGNAELFQQPVALVCCPVQLVLAKEHLPLFAIAPVPPPEDTADAKRVWLGGFQCLIDTIKGAVSMFTLETATAV